jgi:type 1 fimbria pilin
MNKITGILVVALLAISSHAMAKDRIVKCQIDSNNESGRVETIYKGSCSFSPEAKNGSFSLGNAKKDKPLTETIYSVNVSITEKDVAEVFGSVVGGNNSRWGEAKRSTKDKACWEGVDFKVCAW